LSYKALANLFKETYEKSHRQISSLKLYIGSKKSFSVILVMNSRFYASDIVAKAIKEMKSSNVIGQIHLLFHDCVVSSFVNN